MIAIPSIANFGLQSDDALDAFNDELEEGGGIPWCQIVSPPRGRTSSELKKGGYPLGIFITKENAEAVGFQPESPWKETVLVRENKNGEEEEIEGYITDEATFLIIHSSQTEVQKRGDRGYTFMGMAYGKNGLTPEGQLVADRVPDPETDKPPAFCTRYLLVFVGSNGFMQSAPLALSARSAFRATFNNAVGHYKKAMAQAFAADQRSKGKKVTGSGMSEFFLAHCLQTVHLTFFNPPGDRSAYSYPNAYLEPTNKAELVGQSKEIEQDDGHGNKRKVTLLGVDYKNLIIPITSEQGQQIASWFQEYDSFPLPNQGRDQAEEESRQFSGSGHFDVAGIEFDPATQNAVVAFVLADGTVTSCIIPPALSGCLDHPTHTFEVSGILQGGKVVVERVKELDPDF